MYVWKLKLYNYKATITQGHCVGLYPSKCIINHFCCISASEAISAHKKGLGTPLSSGHKLQSPSKKFEAPGKWNYSVALKRECPFTIGSLV